MEKTRLPWLEAQLVSLLAGRERLAHALLLFGPPGVGKSQLAHDFGQALLCESPASGGLACGRCDACGWFAAGNHPDWRRVAPESLDAASGGDATDDGEDEGSAEAAAPRARAGRASKDIKIAQIRALADFIALAPHRGRRKVIQVDPADAMNIPAANALLKSLEEPSGDTVFLLVTSRPAALPATIVSRCVRRPIQAPTADEATAWLAADSGLSPADARTLLDAVGGSPLRARDAAEPAQGTAYRTVMEAVAGIPDTRLQAVVDLLSRLDPSGWLPPLQRWLLDLARVGAGSAPRYFPAQAKRLAQLAGRTRGADLAEAGAWLAQRGRLAEHPLNARLFCEEILLRYAGCFDRADRKRREGQR